MTIIAVGRSGGGTERTIQETYTFRQSLLFCLRVPGSDCMASSMTLQ